MIVVKDWKKYLVDHLAKENDLDEIQEEWLDENGRLVLVDAADFLNRIFNVGTVHDDIQKCVKVEEYCEGHTGCKCSGCRELLRRMN